MTLPTWIRRAAWMVAGPLAGAALAGALAVVLADGRSDRLWGYALGTLPLSVVVWALASRWSPTTAGSGAGWLGAPVALLAALATAQVLAMIRFQRAGAAGAIALSALPFTEEFLMLVPLAPGLLALGGAVARRGLGRPARSLGGAAVVGVVVMLVIGPSLIGVAVAGRTGILNPIVTAIILAFGFAWPDVRRGP